MEIFELSEVAEIVGIPKTKVANWTIGRPLKITPSVRTAFGKGARNLYARDDIYLMSLAEDLTRAGMPSAAIQKVLDAIGAELSNLYDEFIVREESQEVDPGPAPELKDIKRLKVILRGERDDGGLQAVADCYEIRLAGSTTVMVTYETDIAALVERLDKTIMELSLNQPMIGTTKWITADSRTQKRKARRRVRGDSVKHKRETGGKKTSGKKAR